MFKLAVCVFLSANARFYTSIYCM